MSILTNSFLVGAIIYDKQYATAALFTILFLYAWRYYVYMRANARLHDLLGLRVDHLQRLINSLDDRAHRDRHKLEKLERRIEKPWEL